MPDTLLSVIDRLIQRLPGWARTPAETLASAANEYGLDRAGRMAAAIAYRTVFALAPLLIIAVSVVGLVLGNRVDAQQEMIEAIARVAGEEVADLLSSLLTSAFETANTAAIIGGVLLLWTASSLFLEMQHDLNDIFDVPYERVRGLVALVRTRGIGFLWAFGLGLTLIAVWFLNAIWRYLGNLLPPSMSTTHDVVALMAPLVSLVVLPFVFGLVFQTMTAVSIPWKAVWVGGLFTSIVFVAASYGVGIYFQNFNTPSALGFAGSFVVIIFLAYFLSAVFLFGAEVTKVYAGRLSARRSGPVAVVSSDPQVLVSEPPRGLPQAAFIAFLVGLVVGWRKRR
jgi:membrane protein